MYHEASLIPFFLRHYHFADSIRVLLATDDPVSGSLLSQTKRVSIEPFDMPDGMDDGIKIWRMNKAVRQLAEEGMNWIIAADADEFIYPVTDPDCDTIRSVLAAVEPTANVVRVFLNNVYRNRKDRDLDPFFAGPIVLQRAHGDRQPQGGYVKPSVVRSIPLPLFAPGHHSVRPARVSHVVNLRAAHWQMADPSFSIARRVRDRWHRLSKHELAMKWGNGNYDLTNEKVMAECVAHMDDPVVIF